VAKPKVALGWEISDTWSMRFSYSQGFRAPNLEQVNADIVTRSNNRRDPIQCEVDLQAGRIGQYTDCELNATSARRSGNPELKPETSDNISAGIIFQPAFLPESAGRLRLTLDYYKYEQEGIIGLYGEGNALILDYVLRMQGQTNPNVVRAEPNADDIARFAGTGLAPAGQVLYVIDRYVNLLPQTVRGLDFGINWNSPDTRIGRFNLVMNGNKLLEYSREVPSEIQQLFDAGEAGIINPAATAGIGGYGDLMRRNGKVRWKWTGNLFWDYGNVQMGTTARYTSDYYDTNAQYPDGRFWEPRSHTTWNAYLKYSFAHEGLWSGTSIRFGVNNLENRRPPKTAALNGYLATMYSPVPRYWYVNVTKEF